MKYLICVSFVQVWTVVFSYATVPTATTVTEKTQFDLLQGAKTIAAATAEVLDQGIKKIQPLKDVVLPECVEPPLECPNKNITFWYYSRSNPAEPIELSVAKRTSFEMLRRNNNPWKIIIHGYTKSKDEIPNPQLRSAYFENGDYNLISVDYNPIATDGCYVSAVHNVPLIAKCTAQLIEALVENNFFTLDDLHVIGFSLGGQIAGQLKENLNGGKPGRVTGLDPAAPLFDGVVNHKLDQTAGQFVDVIHTNAMFKGKLQRAGHIDFYVNGGLNQPGCLTQNNGSFSTCSHDRSPLYFAESINDKVGFWGVPCESYLKFYSGLCNANEEDLVIMGEYTPSHARGVYYLQTTERAPFALGKKTSV